MRKLGIERLIKCLEHPDKIRTGKTTAKADGAHKSDPYVEGNTSDSTTSDGDNDASSSNSD